MARTKSVIMSKEETKAALAAAKTALKELKAAQKTIASNVIGMKAGHAACGLPPKFIGQSHTMT